MLAFGAVVVSVELANVRFNEYCAGAHKKSEAWRRILDLLVYLAGIATNLVRPPPAFPASPCSSTASTASTAPPFALTLPPTPALPPAPLTLTTAGGHQVTIIFSTLTGAVVSDLFKSVPNAEITSILVLVTLFLSAPRPRRRRRPRLRYQRPPPRSPTAPAPGRSSGWRRAPSPSRGSRAEGWCIKTPRHFP